MSARWRLAGPSFGPLHTTLASGRIGGTRRRPRAGSRWTRRFGSLWYWLLGIWAAEAAFWILYGAVWASLTLWEARHGLDPLKSK
jgi:hypothetical protein